MKIECSRQTCAERTDRQTDKVTPWAPSRSQKYKLGSVSFITIIKLYTMEQ